LQSILNHARQDTDRPKRPNHSFDWVGRVSQINTGLLQQYVQLSVVVSTKRDANPCQMFPSANVMMLNVSSATANGTTSIVLSRSSTAILIATAIAVGKS
jgi:hypothetical protein